MKKNVTGKFEVQATPLPGDEAIDAIGGMKMIFKKKFEGSLEATSVVSMMGLMDQKLGSGGYVALEKLTATLEGKRGTFCMQHSSFMHRGNPSQTVLVIPDSGTGELVGLSGSMTIDIKPGGEHFYNFEYQLEN